MRDEGRKVEKRWGEPGVLRFVVSTIRDDRKHKKKIDLKDKADSVPWDLTGAPNNKKM